MRQTAWTQRFVPLLAIFLALSGCGGSGSGDSPPDTDDTPLMRGEVSVKAELIRGDNYREVNRLEFYGDSWNDFFGGKKFVDHYLDVSRETIFALSQSNNRFLEIEISPFNFDQSEAPNSFYKGYFRPTCLNSDVSVYSSSPSNSKYEYINVVSESGRFSKEVGEKPTMGPIAGFVEYKTQIEGGVYAVHDGGIVKVEIWHSAKPDLYEARLVEYHPFDDGIKPTRASNRADSGIILLHRGNTLVTYDLSEIGAGPKDTVEIPYVDISLWGTRAVVRRDDTSFDLYDADSLGNITKKSVISFDDVEISNVAEKVIENYSNYTRTIVKSFTVAKDSLGAVVTFSGSEPVFVLWDLTDEFSPRFSDMMFLKRSPSIQWDYAEGVANAHMFSDGRDFHVFFSDHYYTEISSVTQLAADSPSCNPLN